MTTEYIQAVGKKHFGECPLDISRKTVGMCNEVYELTFPSDSFILRMHKEKEWMYGTHKFLPLFQKLEIKTPKLLAEDYSKTEFPFCYQLQNKIEGQDLGLVIDTLKPRELKQIAKEVSQIFDKFNSLPNTKEFGLSIGLKEELYEENPAPFDWHRKTIIERNKTSNVVGEELLDIHATLLERYSDYLAQVEPKVYYGDICSKNVMIHEGQFSGLVDLDFLLRGDYLEAIGRMRACWYGEETGDIYINEIIRLQNLNPVQQEMVSVYAILNLILWTSEEGVRFNSNTTDEINWENVKEKKRKIVGLYNSIGR